MVLLSSAATILMTFRKKRWLDTCTTLGRSSGKRTKLLLRLSLRSGLVIICLLLHIVLLFMTFSIFIRHNALLVFCVPLCILLWCIIYSLTLKYRLSVLNVGPRFGPTYTYIRDLQKQFLYAYIIGYLCDYASKTEITQI